jgi:predicted ATPase
VASDDTEAAGLLGRSDDLARLDALAAGARSRRGAAITIVGAPGVGKTALLHVVDSQ